MRAALVVINAGSSSIKFALYDTEPLAPLMRGVIDDIGGHARLVIKKDVE
ncbi:MAG TPA: acetate kinase, partial [Rhizobiales bacterium]|nr:acetate kinase [Hyphomicrobiales bacterium]